MNPLRRLRAHPWFFRLLWFSLIAVPIGGAALFVGVEISSQPAFCGTCHVMRPYYESWRTSSHDDVACVECHIPPGIGAEARKKYEALSMVVSYFTGTYGTNPWAEVPDESCLRPGCHEQRLLSGREVFQSVLFDHRPHLTELRRGKRLRCTSCHSQIVQGQHITVTESTCFLCHFKDQKLNQDTGRCTLCHEIPEKTITTAGLRFDHADVKRFDMDCTLCHAGVVRGRGEVPRDRCLTCHNEPARLARYGATEFLHRTHVTEHKVECLNCHIEIQHEVPEQLETVETDCKTCHVGGGHSPQRDLYVGIGGKGVDPRPSAMYLAGVSCESCHLVTREGRRVASAVSCMSCHGASFMRIYETWQATLSQRLSMVQSQSRKVSALVPPDSPELKRAHENLEFVGDAHAVHNPLYASRLLLQAHEDLKRALETVGVKGELESPPWPTAPYETRCTACHLGAESIVKQTDEGPFRHPSHAAQGRVRCATCHLDASYHQADHGDLIKTCTDCHPPRAELAQASSQDCLGCHAPEITISSQKVKFPHETHIGLGVDCSSCHARISEFDHLELLKLPRRQILPSLDHDFCGRCHGRDVPPAEGVSLAPCMKCHITF